MKSKCRIFLSAAMLVLLAFMLATGCDSQSGTSQSDGTTSQSDGTSTVISSLSPNGVVMVNGKEITKSDLAGRVNDVQISLQAMRESGGQEQVANLTNAELERLAVGLLVQEEIEGFEAERMGLIVSETEVNSQIDLEKQVAAGSVAFSKDHARKSVLHSKLFDEVTKNVPWDAAGGNMAKNIFYDKWLQEAISKYVIIYADQYKSTTTTTKITQ